jgi:hypothetical protein
MPSVTYTAKLKNTERLVECKAKRGVVCNRGAAGCLVFVAVGGQGGGYASNILKSKEVGGRGIE